MLFIYFFFYGFHEALTKQYSKLLIFINLKFNKFKLCKSFKNSMYFEIYQT